MPTLNWLTTNVNLVALAGSLWLGLYAITRSRKSVTAWLAAATLWMLSAFFFQNAIALNTSETNFEWMRFLVILVVPLWMHVTFLLLPAALRAQWMKWGILPLAYAFGLILVAVGVFSDLLLGPRADDPLYATARGAGPLYVLLMPLLGVGFGICLWNLWRAREANRNPALTGQFSALMAATGLVAVAGFFVTITTYFALRVPFVPADLFYFAGIFIFGYSVARYNATLEGRPIDRDLIYTLIVVGSLTLFYCVIMWLLYVTNQVSFLSLALTVVGTVLANSLFDRLRLTMDRVFYQRQFQRLRSNLRGLAREAGAGQTLGERLSSILNTMCRFMRVKHAFIAVRQGEDFVVRATHDAKPLEHVFPFSGLAATETIGLVLPARKNLQDMKLLLPLYAKGAQVGALVLGERENGTPYSEADLELLEDLADQISNVIHGVATQEENAAQLNELVQDFRVRERALQLQVDQMLAEKGATAEARADEWDEEKLTPLVEDALRHMHDIPYLGEHELGKLRRVESDLKGRGDGTPATFLDRGKAVNELLLTLLDELKPDTPAPKGDQIVPREWQLYTILYNSYVLEEPNREVMSKLYVGEGTFNRARRRALRAVAKSLAELEASATL